MEEIGKREFLHNTERYIKPGSFILTRHSVPEFVVTFTTYKEPVKYEVTKGDADELIRQADKFNDIII